MGSGAEIVLDCSGKFLTRAKLQPYFDNVSGVPCREQGRAGQGMVGPLPALASRPCTAVSPSSPAASPSGHLLQFRVCNRLVFACACCPRAPGLTSQSTSLTCLLSPTLQTAATGREEG